MWTSRAAWLDGLRQWAQSTAFGQVCAEARVSITAATLLSIATVMAEHADHATGRHVAVTRATIADKVGCDVRTVTAAWRLLRASRWAVEAQRGHGSTNTPSVGRRPSVYHLVPRREARPATGPVVHDFHLPPSGGVSCSSPVGSYSPNARCARAEDRSSPQKRRRWRAAPRPLAIQRLADELVGNTHGREPLCLGLHRGHIGSICDALTAAGVDPTVWSARAIKAALEADMRARGSSWPDHIANPGAFLHSRLRRLSWAPETVTKAGGSAAASIDQTPRSVVATNAPRAAARAEASAARIPDTEPATSAAGEAGITTHPEQHPAASAHLTRAAVANCPLCDHDGYRGHQVCNHVDHRAATTRGMALIRAELDRANRPVTPQPAAVRPKAARECAVHADADTFAISTRTSQNADAPSGCELAH